MKNQISTYAIVGDSGLSAQKTESLRSSLLRAGNTRLVIPGDNLYDLSLTYEEVWGPWRQQGFEFTAVALGNHTLGYDIEARYFGMTGENHAVQDGPCLFLSLNSDNEATVDQQMKWLESQLESATSQLIFLVFHHPPMTVTDFHKWEERSVFQMALRPVLARYRRKITSIIVGHDHVAGLYSFEKIPMILSGAGSQIREALWVESVRGDVRYHTEWIFSDKPVWARLNADGQTGKVTVDFIETETNEIVFSTMIKAPAPRPSAERMVDAF